MSPVEIKLYASTLLSVPAQCALKSRTLYRLPIMLIIQSITDNGKHLSHEAELKIANHIFATNEQESVIKVQGSSSSGIMIDLVKVKSIAVLREINNIILNDIAE